MDDADYEESRFIKLGFKPQKEKIYNKVLPYTDKLDDESLKLYTDIKTNLTKAVMIREMRPGCVLWMSRFNKYLKIYGFKFSKEDHIILIKLMFELITIPDLEPTQVNKFAMTLTHLLKKKEFIPPEDLELPWRPLHNLCERIMSSSATSIGMYRYFSSLNTNLSYLVHAARIYFPIGSTQEILNEWRPKLCPFDTNTIMDAIEMLEWFLPITLPSSKAHLGYELWFNEFMTLWEVCHNAPSWENDMMWIMARLASSNIGYVNWEPHLPLMFTRFLRSLDLPVSFQNKQFPKRHKIETSAIALWIVSAMGANTSTFKYLQKFMQTLDSYFHPANVGRWSSKLKELFRKLTQHFVQRLHLEQYKKFTWETPVPNEYKLTEADIDKFVDIMKPIVRHTVYTRQGRTDVNLAIHHLASLRPNIIIPIVLDKIYQTLDSPTEPHKLISSIQCLNAVACPLLQGPGNNYPDGPTHVIPLLISLLPGIDPNDTMKCFVTFQLISTFVFMIPIVDSSNASDHWNDLTEEEHAVCEASAGFEDFVLQFLDRVFVLIESSSLENTRLEQVDADKKSKVEVVAESALASMCNAILMQTSPKIFKSALRKFSCFMIEHVLETKVSGQMVAIMCRSFTKVNPDDTLKILLPHLCSRIHELLGDNDDIAKEENLDNELLYNLFLLSEMLDCNGTSLLPYIDKLVSILNRTLHLECCKGSNMASKLLNNILMSLTVVQTMDYRSSPLSFSRDVKDHLTIRDWGKPGNINKLGMKWYQPGETEISCVQQLLNRYLPPEIECLESYIDNKVTLTREKLRRSLCIVLAVLGCHTLLPMWDESALELIPSKMKPWAFKMIIGPEPSLVMPDGRNVRSIMCNVMHRLQHKILNFAEDDTKSLFILISIWNMLLMNKFRGRDFESHWKSFQYFKKMHKNRLHGGKSYLRQVLIDRVMLHQELRTESRSCKFSETHRQIMIDLYTLSVSHYSEVRIRAQKNLFSALAVFPYSYTVLTPYLMKSLQVDSDKNHEEFKGCLYVLLGPKSSPILIRHDWSFVSKIWPLLIMSKPSEKISVINLLNNIMESVHKHFPTISINLNFPQSCIQLALDYSRSTPSLHISLATNDEVKQGINMITEVTRYNKAIYKEMVDVIFNALSSGNLHWRHHLMALSVIRDLVHPDEQYNEHVVNLVLQTLIHESLDLRKLAIRIMVYILKQHKKEHKKMSVNLLDFAPNYVSNSPGFREDNKWIQYDSKIIPLTEVQWDQPKYLHKQFNGYYAWPEIVKMYAPSKCQPKLDRALDEMTSQEKLIHAFFSVKSNVDKLINYLSMEEKKGKDKFNVNRFMMFKNLFNNYGDAFLGNFVPHIEHLVMNKEESYQRCATEIICALIRGAKHWPFEKVSNLWTVLIPIIRKALANMTSETVSDWGTCFSTATEGRDPNRLHWLYELLMEDPLRDEASFIESSRLYTLQGTLNQQAWRVSELYQRLLLYLKDFLMHPFQNVRERISSILVNVFEVDLVFPNGNQTQGPRISEFMKEIVSKLNVLHATNFKETGSVVHVEDELHQATNILKNLNFTEDERDVTIRLFKTVCKWVMRNILKANYGARPEYYELFPLACLLQSYEADEELSQISLSLLGVMAQSFTICPYIPTVLTAIEKVSKSNSWSARAVSAEYMQVFVFHNMATLLSNEQWLIDIRKIVLNLLEDEIPEVRFQASQVLGGLFHCQFIQFSNELLNYFKTKAKTKLLKCNTKTGTDKNLPLAIRMRHAGILGMCAYINAHPYDVPDILPEIFLQLNAHLTDPLPILTTIRKTLGDFKRTHHDNWEVHRLKFTEEELSVLGDLTVPLSHYS